MAEQEQPATAGAGMDSSRFDVSEDNRKRILVVEDNPINQKVVTSLLRKKGFPVDVACDGMKALQAMEERKYALILMDVQMPVLDGLETTRRLRADYRFARIPIIAMTAHAMNGDKERCLQAGMNAYLAKPVDHAHLLATIDQYLTVREPLKEVAAERQTAADKANILDADPGLVGQMYHLFLQLAPERLENLRDAVKRGDVESLRGHAEKLKSAAHRISAVDVERSVEELERASGLAQAQAIHASLIQLERAISRMCEQSQPSQNVI
jgi:CheY-like chemotaxis protein